MGRGEDGRGRERREIVPSHLALWDWPSRGTWVSGEFPTSSFTSDPAASAAMETPHWIRFYLPIASSGTGTEIDKPFLQSAT